MILLQPQQILSGDAQKQMITGLQATVGQRRQQPFTAALQLQDIHIETSLQAAVVQGAAHQFRIPGDGDFRAVAAPFRADGQVIPVAATIRQQNPWGQHQIHGPRQPDRQADQGEAEQLQGSIAQLLADVADQQVHRAAEQGEGSPQDR